MSKHMRGYFAILEADVDDPPTILGPYATYVHAMAAIHNHEYTAARIVLGEFTIKQTVRVVTVPDEDTKA